MKRLNYLRKNLTVSIVGIIAMPVYCIYHMFHFIVIGFRTGSDNDLMYPWEWDWDWD